MLTFGIDLLDTMRHRFPSAHEASHGENLTDLNVEPPQMRGKRYLVSLIKINVHICFLYLLLFLFRCVVFIYQDNKKIFYSRQTDKVNEYWSIVDIWKLQVLKFSFTVKRI